MEGCAGSDRDGSGFLVGHVGWLCGNHAGFGKARVLGVRAKSHKGGREDPFALSESGYVFACLFDFPGELAAENRPSGFQYAEGQTGGDPEREGHREAPAPGVCRRYGGRVHSYQHFIVPGNRFVHFSET